MIQVGRVCRIVRYPVKSMAGAATESAFVGWHGLDGDRRFALRRIGDAGGFPWLSASRLPELILYHPVGLDESTGERRPTHVRMPAGSCVELRSPELKAELSERLGSSVDLMNLSHGIFDEAPISVVSLATIAGIGREAGLDLDRRRFRPNIVVETERGKPFVEDEWVGQTLRFGNGDTGPAVSVTMCDARCMMINLDPETGEHDPRIENGRASQREQRRRVCDGRAARYNAYRRSSEPCVGRICHARFLDRRTQNGARRP